MKGKSKSSHDLLKDDPKLSSVPVVDRTTSIVNQRERERIRENISQKLKRVKTDEKTSPDTMKKTSCRMAHVLHFDEQTRKVKDANMLDEDTVEIYDPHNPVNKRR